VHAAGESRFIDVASLPLSAAGSGANFRMAISRRRVSLEHVKQMDPPPPPIPIRKAWPGGTVTSNKELATYKFIKRKQVQKRLIRWC
jgi:hypothetical protein